MSFQCTQNYSITINPAGPTPGSSDMPLDQAIYVASNDKIYGVRGQYVYQFNATTAALENTFRFIANSIFGESSIVNVGTKLYCGFWRSMSDPAAPIYSYGDIVEVDLALTTATPLNLGTSIIGSGPGFSNLITDGTLIYGSTAYQRTVAAKGRFSVDPTNTASYSEWDSVTSANYPTIDLVWDSVNKVIWEAESVSPELDGYYVPAGTMTTSRFIASVTPPPLYGVALYPTGTKLYCVGMNRTITKVDGNVAVATLPVGFTLATSTSLTNILAVGAAPMRIKYNSNDGLIYVPTWAGDTVEILDPSSDTISAIKSGFSSPFDVVFTPTKKFAVQNSAVGLKEIV